MSDFAAWRLAMAIEVPALYAVAAWLLISDHPVISAILAGLNLASDCLGGYLWGPAALKASGRSVN